MKKSLICFALVFAIILSFPAYAKSAGNVRTAKNSKAVKKTKASKKSKTAKKKKIPANKKRSRLEVHFINVGEGDCILICSKMKAMIIDFGVGSNKKKICAYLKKQGVYQLEYAVATHPHVDHMGSMPYVINNIPVKKVMMTDYYRDISYYHKTIAVCKKKKIPIHIPHSGETCKLGNKVFLQFLAPNSTSYERLNNYSLVIRLTYGKTSFLLTGDAEKPSEEEMIEKYGSRLKSDVMKLAHHGGWHATSDEFLDVVKPDRVVLSTGPNSVGLPSQSVIEKLKKRKIPCYRTDKHGTVVAFSDGKTIKWKKER